MECSVNDIEALLNELARKTGQSRDRHGYGVMSEMVGQSEITQRYLYDNLSRGAKAASDAGNNSISLQIYKLDILATYLGYETFQHFCQGINNPVSPILTSLAGNYYCYVRRNMARGAIYRSPVRISNVENRMLYTLAGPVWNYAGELSLSNGCLFVLMKAEGGKAFFHVYKIGTRKEPQVLQGIFSGVSTAFDPIGGRVVLTRETEAFEKLSTKELDIEALKKSEELTERRIAEYFEDYSTNNLALNRIVTYGLDDLGNGE